MPRRPRTGKQLAKRHDLSYFKHSTRFWKLRRGLSYGLPAIALLWVGLLWARGNQKVYSSGPVSHAHAVFGNNCATCHTPRSGVERAMFGGAAFDFRKHVTDKACLTCHDAPAHSTTQTATPECGSCHVEHKGAVRLAATTDATCTQCHSNLKDHAKGGVKVAAMVDGFNRNHPEFEAVSKHDPGTIKFNHFAHLHQTIKDMQGNNVDLQCEGCHKPLPRGSVQTLQAAARDSAETRVVDASTNESFSKPSASGAYMAPFTFKANCESCHWLQFDSRFPDQVPHDKPDVVHRFLVAKYTDYIAAHPGEMRGGAPQRDLRIVSPILKGEIPAKNTAARTPQEWVTQRVADAEDLMWRKTCRGCHTVSFPPSTNVNAAQPLPLVANPAITVRWLTHGLFDHQSHRMVACDSCHVKARKSQDTADVLVPSIKTCQSCHKGAPERVDAAENRCFECHQYHNWGKTAPTKGKYTIPQLLGELQTPAKPETQTQAGQ